jgi:kinesin family protein 22
MQGTHQDPGIIPRSVESILSFAQENKTPTKKTAILISYLEIYNEKIYDLLSSSCQDLPIREDQSRNIFIPNLTETEIVSIEDFRKTYEIGCKNRTVAGTKLNSQSSRSHAILLLKVITKDNNKTLCGKLNLIDLAGSEDNRRTDNKGIRLTESSNINQSLFVLAKVVNSLNRGDNRIPYRDSKLTRILQDSLGGNALSLIIANIAPGQQFYLDTYNTLNFASKSRSIINNPTVNCEYGTKKNFLYFFEFYKITQNKKIL